MNESPAIQVEIEANVQDVDGGWFVVVYSTRHKNHVSGWMRLVWVNSRISTGARARAYTRYTRMRPFKWSRLPVRASRTARAILGCSRTLLPRVFICVHACTYIHALIHELSSFRYHIIRFLQLLFVYVFIYQLLYLFLISQSYDLNISL